MTYSAVKDAYRDLLQAWQSLSEDERQLQLDHFVLDYAYNSGKIENDAITYHDTHEIFENGKVIAYTGDVRTLFEIENLKTSWEWARALSVPTLRFDQDLLLKAHELLTHGTYDENRWAQGERPGTYKQGDYVVGALSVGVPAEDVAHEVDILFDDVNEYMGSTDQALVIAAYLHACFVDIHPFADGNGRCARLLMNMVLIALVAPPVVIREQDRLAYYGALDAFHEKGDLEPLKDFLMAESLMTWEGMLNSR